jgi:hypothetical protein
MTITFCKLNQGWNAEPNAPNPRVKLHGADLLLTFVVNPFKYHDFVEEDVGILRFTRCERYRLGPTNDEGWYRGQSRFSKLAHKWGEFYEVTGDASLLEEPVDWQVLQARRGQARHFLFYFRDNTFECVADDCVIEPTAENSLLRTNKQIVVQG